MLAQLIKKGVFLSAVLLAPSAVLAGADCPKAPKDSWMSELDMQKKIVNEYGFSIHKFKVDGNCYEIYGMMPKDKQAETPEWVKVEVYFNPVDGEIVKQKQKD